MKKLALVFLFLGLVLLASERVDAQPCSITCRSDVTQGNDANQCGAIVNYPAPTGSCDNVSCDPPAGSFFSALVGENVTIVTCDDTVDPDADSCSFNVTINDTEPPAIDCPANIDMEVSGPTIINYSESPSDNCPGVTSDCLPPSGSEFSIGESEVDCTATDLAQNTATCSFLVDLQQALPTPSPTPSPTPTASPIPTPSPFFPVGTLELSGSGLLSCSLNKTVNSSPSAMLVFLGLGLLGSGLLVRKKARRS